jgi:hypothetical protein
MYRNYNADAELGGLHVHRCIGELLAAALMTDTFAAASAFRRSLSSAVQGPFFIGHLLVKNTVASQHQITAKLAGRKMLTCFTFPPTVSSFGQPSGFASGTFMAEYRVYLVDRDDHFFDTVHLSCAGDAEAIEQALALAIGHGVELWQLDRKVAVFPDHNTHKIATTQ